MGHGQKNQSRHQQMVETNARVLKLSKAVGGLADVLAKEDKTRVKRFVEIEKKLSWLADELTDEHLTTLRRLNALTNTVEFNALPIWKRWWKIWKGTRARLKDANKPVFLGAIELDAERDNLDPDLGPPAIMDLDFEDDVLPEIERQTGPIPEELKAECKAAGITDAEEVIFPSEMNVDPVELARFKAGFVEHTKKSRGPQTVISEHDKAAAADRQHDADREATLGVEP